MNGDALTLRVLNADADLLEQSAMHSQQALARALQYSQLALTAPGVPRNVPHRQTAQVAGSEIAARYEQTLARAHDLTRDLVDARTKGDYVAEFELSRQLTEYERRVDVQLADVLSVDSGRGYRAGVSDLYVFTVGAVQLAGKVDELLPAVSLTCFLWDAEPDLRDRVRAFLNLDPGSSGAYAAPYRYNRHRQRYCRNERVDERLRVMLGELWASPATAVL